MTIQFHCEHCGKQVKTASEHAGKRGKCPHCHQSVYIPTPPEELEPLRLAPVDETAEQEKRRLEEETRALTRALQSEHADVPPEPAERGLPLEPLGDARLTHDMELLIVDYVVAMSEGRLPDAEKIAEDIHANWELAAECVQRITMDELPPARLAKIPRPLLNGFLKQLREHAH